MHFFRIFANISRQKCGWRKQLIFKKWKFSLRALLGFCFIFWQFLPGLLIKTLLIKKACISLILKFFLVFKKLFFLFMPCEIRIIRWHKLRYNIIYEYIKQIAWKQLYRDKLLCLKAITLVKIMLKHTKYTICLHKSIDNCRLSKWILQTGMTRLRPLLVKMLFVHRHFLVLMWVCSTW